ncbi:hypothetical protein [Georgenia sp. MJ170]|uniref:hypothetical protein n=1 Tax=Georgenia sunbinii TaxID=3117728 RepID=UPI002F26387E
MTGGRLTRPGGTHRRTLWAITVLGGLSLVPTVAHAETVPTGPPAPEQGDYLRLDADPGQLLLSPGDSAQWRVGVDLVDPPTPGDIALRIDADGSLTDVEGGMTLSMSWCDAPDARCEGGTALLPATPAANLPDAPLQVDGLSSGWLLVTATVPEDALRSAQGRELRVAVDAHAQGSDAPAPDDEPSTPADTPPASTSAPDAVEPPGRLTTSGAPLLAPALLAAASVLVGAGLAGARRLSRRRQEEMGSSS